MKNISQIQRIIRLMKTKRGVTSAELCARAGSVSPHSVIATLKKEGHLVTKQPTTRDGCKFIYRIVA